MSESFLDRILEHKRVEVDRQKRKVPQADLEAQLADAPPIRDFAQALCHPERTTLIAEVKKASPSRGVLLENFDPLQIAAIYQANGAAALSVLTDQRFFQGSLKFLQGIRLAQTQPVPLLRKDFMVDPYQIYEARVYGADAILLIVAALEDQVMAELLAITRNLGMEALVEVHDLDELARALAVGARIVGVNNRNLHTFVTDLATTEQVAAQLPAQQRPVLVSESGIFTPADVARVRAVGADAVLIGEALVTANDIAAQVRRLAGMEN